MSRKFLIPKPYVINGAQIYLTHEPHITEDHDTHISPQIVIPTTTGPLTVQVAVYIMYKHRLRTTVSRQFTELVNLIDVLRIEFKEFDSAMNFKEISSQMERL